MRSAAGTVKHCRAQLPENRRRAIQTVRRTILENLPMGNEEAMTWEMITCRVPLETFPETFNCQRRHARPRDRPPGDAGDRRESSRRNLGHRVAVSPATVTAMRSAALSA